MIAHGLGGTVPEDRFCQLALEIKRTNPNANVLLIDWSSTAAQTRYGFPRIWHIAGCLDAIAADAASGLSSLEIDPDHTTLIGESFGVYVQGQIAKALGGVRHILAFNPASETGGYEPINLCKYSNGHGRFIRSRLRHHTANRSCRLLFATPEKPAHCTAHSWHPMADSSAPGRRLVMARAEQVRGP